MEVRMEVVLEGVDYRLGRGMKETSGVLNQFGVETWMMATKLSMYIKLSLNQPSAESCLYFAPMPPFSKL